MIGNDEGGMEDRGRYIETNDFSLFGGGQKELNK